MTAAPLKSEVRAEEYRARAHHAQAAARSCGLDNARERHERAAAAWIELAEGEERRALRHRDLVGSLPPKPTPSFPPPAEDAA